MTVTWVECDECGDDVPDDEAGVCDACGELLCDECFMSVTHDCETGETP